MSNYFIQTYTWNPWHNLAAEAYLASHIQKGDIMLYLWQNDHTVVIGKNQNALAECRAQLLESKVHLWSCEPENPWKKSR